MKLSYGDDRGVCRNGITDSHMHCRNGAGYRRFDGVLHFHRFEDSDLLACLDRIPDFYGDADDVARKRSCHCLACA